ncbi:MAG: hypothetical protein H6Q74_531 [Firmicutes bacterium]|nr:hypothetical protein [Bacillota bacterium]
MIAGYLSNINSELALYPQALKLGLNFLAQTDIGQLALGQHEIQGTAIYAIVSEYQTQPMEERRPEAHQKYVDIQYVFSGREIIGVAPLSPESEIEENCFSDRDVAFFSKITQETELTLLPGMFAVFFPWDVHRPNCADSRPSKVRKVVVKIALEALGGTKF